MALSLRKVSSIIMARKFSVIFWDCLSWDWVLLIGWMCWMLLITWIIFMCRMDSKGWNECFCRLNIFEHWDFIYSFVVAYAFLLNTFSSWIKEVRYNWSAHRSAHLQIITRSSNSNKEWKQPQIIFCQYSCSVTMISIVKKYLWREIHELNTLIGTSDDS